MIAALRCRHLAGSPARRRGNFLLRGQKKVTKEEALNRTRAPRGSNAACNRQTQHAPMRTAALSRLTFDERASSPHLPVRRAAARRAHQNSPMQRRPSGAAVRYSGGSASACSRALSRVLVRALVLGTSGGRERSGSRRGGSQAEHRERAFPLECGLCWRLSFGDFSLARQRKVTRPRGADSRGTATSQEARRRDMSTAPLTE